jgi:hypothetical protein
MGLRRGACKEAEEAKMTQQRDLKRRVRDRQAQTGESYMTALRHVQAQKPPAFPVVELVDLTEVGAALGFKCRIVMAPGLTGQIDTASALVRLRDVLLTRDRDGALETFRAVVLRGERRQFRLTQSTFDDARELILRARAGLGGVSEGGRLLAMHVDGKSGAIMVLFTLWIVPEFVPMTREPSLILASLEGTPTHPLLAWMDTP